MSPPAGVHARPTATPGRFTRSAISVSTRTWMLPRNSLSNILVDNQLLRLAFHNTPRFFAAHRSNHLLELANAGLARVVPHNVANGSLREFDLLRR